LARASVGQGKDRGEIVVQFNLELAVLWNETYLPDESAQDHAASAKAKRRQCSRYAASWIDISSTTLDHSHDGASRPTVRARQLQKPRITSCPIHLSSVGSADDARKIESQRHGFFPIESVNLNLQILRHEFAYHHRSIQQPPCHHALTNIGRKRLGAVDHSHR
jgi:hypothetical protein